MKNKILKKLLIIMLIMMLTATDFFMLGSSIVSYAMGLDSSTNNENIEFSAYFKNTNGERVTNITESIKKSDLKLFAEIKVKNEGYLNGAIEIENSNFKIKNNILSNVVTSIEGNKVNLNQINAGETVEIELDIEPIISETLNVEMLAKDTTVKLTGTYMETTYKGLNIEASKTVNLKLKADETAQAELETEVITNKVFSINGENKRLVQLMIKSKLTENQYPVKQTVLNVNVPQLGETAPEEVKVLSLGTKATNGKTDATIENWKNENGIVEITIKNDPNENNEISWKKDVYDEIIVTFVYDENVDASKVEIKTSSEIQIYNSESKFTAGHTVGIENTELNNIITSEEKVLTTDVYKGQLYENAKNAEKKEMPFETKTIVEIKNKDIADKITVKEEKDVFTTDATEIAANTKFISTEINKAQMIEILGEQGSIQFKHGETVDTITKDTETNESGNIVINYQDIVSELEIVISKPEKEGILEIKHQKAITEDANTTEVVKTIKALKVKNTIVATLGETNVVENTTETIMELKETTSKAELIINKENLSTMTQNKDFMLGIKLNTADQKYDLYKNPKIKIQLPSSVEEININSFDKLYGDEFEIEKAVYNPGNKTIEISLKGEQLKYAENDATQLYIQINFDVTLSKTEPSKQDKITMQYTNENAVQYDGNVEGVGYVEKIINISSPSGLVAMNNTPTYNKVGIKGISEEQQVIQLAKSDAGKEIKFEVGLINNTGKDIKNVNILGKLPTDSISKTRAVSNTLTTTLKGVTADTATVYYSENPDATTDITDANNGWTNNLSNLANPKVYLIKVDEMKAQSNYLANYNIQLPSVINNDQTSYTSYKVTYDTDSETGIEVASTEIGLLTPTEVKMETGLTATVGNVEIKSGDTVKAGEVIKYKVTVKNTGVSSIENALLKASVPTGTVVVEPEEEYQYVDDHYYKERTDIAEINQSIAMLAAGETYTYEYEVRVKSDITTGTEILNKAIVTCGETTVESTEIKNTLSESNIRVTIKSTMDDGVELIAGSDNKYIVYVENLSNEVIKDLKLQFLSNNKFTIDYILNAEITITSDIPEEINISEIPANGLIYFQIAGKIALDVTELNVTAIVKDSDEKIYRSNKLTEKVENVNAKITMSSPQDNKYLEENDAVEYFITVENISKLDGNIVVTGKIPYYLNIEKVYINEKLLLQSTENSQEGYTEKISNDIYQILELVAGEKAEIHIYARVNEITENFETKVISHKAEVYVYGNLKDTSSEITHILTVNDSSEKLGNIISGKAWLDQNLNGQIDKGETLLSGIKVILYDISTNDIAKNREGNNVETTTNENGLYTLTNLNDGNYIVLFDYDMEKYEPTTYQIEGSVDSVNSNAILKNIMINGEERKYAVTDIINVTKNLSNINLGLKEILIYDLELNKYISKIVVQNSKKIKTYDYENSTFAKVEINSKQLNGSLVILEYGIRVKNNGEVAGYVNNIVDYLPEGLTFSSELNPDWYISGNNLYTKSLANEKINPGEEKEVKLILTKTITENNVGLINNRAELFETYNEYGLKDINSTENNQAKNENDLGSADVAIAIATGGKMIVYGLLIIINTGLIAFAIYLIFIKNNKKFMKIGRRQ